MPRQRSAKEPRDQVKRSSHKFIKTSNSPVPFDVLEEIFAIGLTWVNYQLELLTWTHVCREWRYTALRIPRLWAHIDISKTGLTCLFVERSATQPLYLTSSSYRPRCGDALKQVASRVKSINVRVRYRSFSRLIELLGPDLPCTDELKLEVPDWTGYGSTISPPPGIKRLKLVNISTQPWSCCAGLHELTHLSLTRSTQINVKELVTILAGSPYLESLKLIQLKPQPTSFPPKMQTATLSYLRKLYIEVEIPEILFLLRYLLLPPTAQIHIDCFGPDRFDYLLPAKPILADKTVDLHHVHLDWDGIQFFDSLSALRTGDPSKSLVWISWYTPQEFLPSLPNLFALQTVTSLSLGTFVRISGDPHFFLWKDICVFLRALPNLESLYVCFHPIERLLSILANYPVAESWYTPQDSMPCTHLQLISFSPSEARRRVTNFAMITELARRRREASIPLRTIEVMRPSVRFLAHRSELERFVDVVVVH